ncbi:hypothetical protein PtB15_6B286 [Puccinia triticina]|nr:hypothetical protein PtB15_6B286 [Puccinia triticina]
MAAKDDDPGPMPSTPPNNPNLSGNQPQSTRRESSPVEEGEETDSHDDTVTIQASEPKNAPRKGASAVGAVKNGTSGLNQIASRTGKNVTVNLEQDSKDEHDLVAFKQKAKDKDKDGYDHPRL